VARTAIIAAAAKPTPISMKREARIGSSLSLLTFVRPDYESEGSVG